VSIHGSAYWGVAGGMEERARMELVEFSGIMPSKEYT